MYRYICTQMYVCVQVIKFCTYHRVHIHAVRRLCVPVGRCTEACTGSYEYACVCTKHGPVVAVCSSDCAYVRTVCASLVLHLCHVYLL